MISRAFCPVVILYRWLNIRLTQITPAGKALAFDYEAIASQWSTTLIDANLLARFERVTGQKPHRLMRRGLFFSHRDFDKILDTYERGDPFFIYTGRGPSSSSMHIGHTVPFEFTKFLSDAFDVPLVIMLTDDEKFLFNEKGLTIEEAEEFAMQNAKDIIGMGFNPARTFLYTDFKYIASDAGSPFYKNITEFARLIPQNQVRGAFGFDDSTNIGRILFPAVQCSAAFATSYPHIWGDSPLAPRSAATAKIPCLIPCAIDQDPYFRLLRSNEHRMKFPIPKTALIHSKFLTALQGPGGKMSASDPTSAIFTSDSKKQIKDKINKYAFSGGRDTLEEHRRLGGNPDVDVPFQYLTYFLEDDEELARIERGYRAGEILTGELKKLCIDLLTEHIGAFQERREQVSEDDVEAFMRPRKLEFKGNPNPTTKAQNAGGSNANKDTDATTDDSTRVPEGSASAEKDGASRRTGRGSDAANRGLPLSPSKTHYTRPQRPGMPQRTTTYGITGLSKYGKMAEDLLYPGMDESSGDEALKKTNTTA